jgi:hypothetical protein
MAIYIKDPDATLDFAFDWSDWLADSETISTYTITAQTGLTKTLDSQANGIVTVWVSGGTAGNWYSLACKIVTNANRTDERTMRIQVQDR